MPGSEIVYIPQNTETVVVGAVSPASYGYLESFTYAQLEAFTYGQMEQVL